MACGSVEPQNSNAANTGTANAGPKELPQGMSTSPVPPSGNATPGIPDPKNANAVTSNGPIPGIDPKNANKPPKPGATPTPGIDPEAARRQMNQPSTLKGPPPPPANNPDKKPEKKPRINER